VGTFVNEKVWMYRGERTGELVVVVKDFAATGGINVVTVLTHIPLGSKSSHLTPPAA